jgi:hypothetical protein
MEPATVEVASRHTSGEAEPVLIKLPSDELYVGVGSDHTDRHLERTSVLVSKQVCPKVLGCAVWPFEQVAERWGALRLSSEIGPGIPYQDASLALMKPPLELLRTAEERFPSDGSPLVLFLGTVPLKTPLAFHSIFTAEIYDPGTGQSISCCYEIEVIGVDADEEVR